MLANESGNVETEFSQVSLIERIKQALANLGLFIENGIVKIKELVVERLKIGGREQPSGITLYDEEQVSLIALKRKEEN